ncbi:Fur family transcriptional regulator [Oscillatoria sp. FACHB-1406]|uniref:Fur family transcriptional regulator n=1 Tax=Oscillatoria sp. FACHB-1406 TaxID=2692846 RepID=UPI0016869724|nr:Fur family transcriptional regulator [Oscillatoria sp. FACHB-1406]MBD2580361.1 transcriptional repressor [Oscillatoria sp. FACHB-1406]
MRRTRSQEKILSFLDRLNREISAQELYLELRTARQGLGLATVYRSLEALKLGGLVQVRTLANGESLYSCAKKDQHHVTCVNCGRSLPLDCCPVRELERQLQESHNFKVYYHTLEFFGLCDRCHNPSLG